MILGVAFGLAGCQPPQKYYWGNYSASLYAFYGDAKAEANYQKALAEITAADAKGKKIPPGLYAEYGYEELAHGNVDHAIELFEREKETWPEAGAFMDKAIATARSGKQPNGASPGPQAAPASNNPPST
jgi:hypothetical protein